MKLRLCISLSVVLLLILFCTGCAEGKATSKASVEKAGQIYLYGEAHGQVVIIEKEFELWKGYYDNQGMRHLFIEESYYGAEFLNLWMKADDDKILDQLFRDFVGTMGSNDVSKNFLKRIKIECPKTVFHGTDVGHLYGLTGARYLSYLEDHNLKESNQYELAKICIDQGDQFYATEDHEYRENMMAENFKREFDNLKGESVMGIYGAAHTGLDALDLDKTIPCMANQLSEVYKGRIQSEDLTYLVNIPLRMETLEVDGKIYQASYFGESPWNYGDILSYEVWRLEDAYEDCKGFERSGAAAYSVFPYDIELGQVFVVDQKKTDKIIVRKYYRADGEKVDGILTLTGFIVE